jgi:quercetin dioxygenase-like cupin family protein
MPSYVVIEKLLQEIEIPENGSVDRTVYGDDKVKVVLLASSGGQVISPPTENGAAMVEVLQGEVRLTIEGEEKDLAMGSWAFLPPKLCEVIYARTKFVILMTILGGAGGS